jgi:O-antigen/teichoic acid export membrane protein
VVLANYSFAYKVFEMASLPLLVIAPILIPKFTKHFKEENGYEQKRDLVIVLLRIEMIIAAFTVLLLNIFWAPVIDAVTNTKYGSVNNNTILILSACLPLLYFNNILWLNSFSKGDFKLIFGAMAFTFIINIAGDIALIPFYKAEGAAVAFLAALIAQSIFYLIRSTTGIKPKESVAVVICPLLAIVSGFTAVYFFKELWMITLFALSVFTAMLLLTRQLRAGDWHLFKQLLGF